MFKLNDLFKKDFLLERINDCEGLTDVVKLKNCIEVYDEEEDMFLYFHHTIDYDNLFDFGSLNVDKEKFFKTIDNSLEKILFLMPKKIYFISSQEELDALINTEEYCCQSLDMDGALGINWHYDSTIVINAYLCRKVCEEDIIDDIFEETLEESFNRCIWTTLIHELRHMVCNLGVIIPDELIPISEGSEEKVEDYAINCFEKKVFYEDYICFK